MNVSLTPELEKFVRQKVKSGRYLSVSEVIQEALRHEKLVRSNCSIFWVKFKMRLPCIGNKLEGKGSAVSCIGL